MTLVTVVTPCLDPGDRLASCLDSVARQTYDRVEHLVVDGGSTDGTVDVLERSGVRFVSEPDGGQTDALCKGFALARGDFLTWLNADDTLRPEASEVAVESGADWVYGDCDVVEGGRHSLWRPLPDYGPWHVAAGEMIPQPGSFFARSAYDAVGGLDPSFDLAMDVDLWIRLVDAGVRAAYVPRILAEFEIHPASKTGSAGRAAFLLEHALALAKSGRGAAASAAVGRAARHDPEAARGVLRAGPQWLDERIVAAATRAESGVERLRTRDVRGLRELAVPSVWAHAPVRRRLVAAARRELRR